MSQPVDETKAKPPYQVKKSDLPAACPPEDSEAIGLHPRVYLKFNDGVAKCPYCGAKFALAD